MTVTESTICHKNNALKLRKCEIKRCKDLNSQLLHPVAKFNPIQDGEAKRPLLPVFLPVISTNVGINLKNFLGCILQPFAKLVQNFKSIPSASPKLLNLNQGHLSKKQYFWSKTYKIEVMITSLLDMLELPHFGYIYMITSTILFESRNNFYW